MRRNKYLWFRSVRIILETRRFTRDSTTIWTPSGKTHDRISRRNRASTKETSRVFWVKKKKSHPLNSSTVLIQGRGGGTAKTEKVLWSFNLARRLPRRLSRLRDISRPSFLLTNMCVSSFSSCTAGIWLRNTNGRCRSTSRLPSPPESCGLCRSTSGRSRRRRCSCHCTAARECLGCQVWDSSRRTAATALHRRDPSPRAAYAPDCTASTESCNAVGVRDRHGAGARSCSLNCWWWHYY